MHAARCHSPNAIANGTGTGTGKITIREMVAAGLWLNIVHAFYTTVLVTLWFPVASWSTRT